MTKHLLSVLIIFFSVALAACEQASPPRLRDNQIVCTLRGEAFVFIDGYEKSVHSVRSVESDPLCQPLKEIIKMKTDPSMAPAYAPGDSQ